jgi:hypothetical protein
MRHSAEFSYQHPVRPLASFPRHVQAGCTYRPVTRDARTRDDSAAALTKVMAIRHMEGRVVALEPGCVKTLLLL